MRKIFFYLRVIVFFVDVLQAGHSHLSLASSIDSADQVSDVVADTPKAPKQLLPNFFNGRVRLLPRVRKAFLAINDDLVIQKMNTYLESCTPRQQEMFIEMLNQTTPPAALKGTVILHTIVDQAIKLTNMTKTDNWVEQKPNTSFARSLGSSIRSLFPNRFKKTVNIEQLFKSALTGDEDSIEEIRKFAEKKINLSFADKKKLLEQLQLQTAELLDEINQKVVEKNNNIQLLYPDDLERQAEVIRDIGQQQEANTRAVVKYSKDILRALRPMCNNDQHLMHIVDRTTLAPVLNILDFKDFPLGGIRSRDELSNFIAEKVRQLHAQGKMDVPTHVETKLQFIESVKNAVLHHHPEIKFPADMAYESIASSPKDERDVAVFKQIKDLDIKTRQREWMREHVQKRLNKLIDRKGFEDHREQISV